MTPPERMRALLAKPDFVVMPAVWDGLTAKLTHEAGFQTAFLSGSCVAASRLIDDLCHRPLFPRGSIIVLIALAGKNAILIVAFAKTERERGRPLIDSALRERARRRGDF